MSSEKVPVKTNGKRNKNAGKNWELEIIGILKNTQLYPHAVSTRSESRSLDGYGIDIMNRNEGLVGIMQDSIQAKTETRMVQYAKLLDRIRQAGRPNPVIFHRQTSRSKGGRFMARDHFAICYLEEYVKLLRCRKALTDLVAVLPKDLPLPENIKQQIEKLGL